MGYGEFGGGGSVHWRVNHRGNGNGNGGPNGGNGRDPVPSPSDGGTFTILVDGSPITAPIPINFGNRRQIEIVWSPDTLADLDRLRREADQQAGGGGGNPHAQTSPSTASGE